MLKEWKVQIMIISVASLHFYSTSLWICFCHFNFFMQCNASVETYFKISLSMTQWTHLHTVRLKPILPRPRCSLACVLARTISPMIQLHLSINAEVYALPNPEVYVKAH